MITPAEERLDNLEYVKRCIDGAKNIVVLTGAGISTESGVPDFASLPDYFDEDEQVTYTRQEVMSEWFFFQKPDVFYAYMKEHLSTKEVEPNSGHRFLAELEKQHKVTIVTQNIDGLHEKAGSTNVIPYHGTLSQFYCPECDKVGKMEDTSEFLNTGKLFHEVGTSGRHLVLPNITLYGQDIDPLIHFRAVQSFKEADVILVMGTAMEVYPAAGLVLSAEANGKRKICINKTQPAQPVIFDIVLQEAIGEVVQSFPMDEAGNLILGKTPEHQVKIAASRYKVGDTIKRSDFVSPDAEEDEDGEQSPDEEWVIQEVDIDESEPDESIIYLLSNRKYSSPEKYKITYALLKDCDFVSH